MAASEKSLGTVVIGTVGEDIHNLGISILEHALRSAGFKVVYLGVRCAQEEYIKASIETNADVIMVSTLSGHAEISAGGLREKCIEAGLKDILLYIGGKLIIGEPPWQETEKLFKDLGFNRAYPPRQLPGPVIDDLKADLGIKV